MNQKNFNIEYDLRVIITEYSKAIIVLYAYIVHIQCGICPTGIVQVLFTPLISDLGPGETYGLPKLEGASRAVSTSNVISFDFSVCSD
jgi:hypothetical protein